MPGLDKNFERIVSEALPSLSLGLAHALRGTIPRPPIDLGDTNTAGPSPFDQAAISNFFSADEASQTYYKAITAQDPEYNKILVKISAKLQSDTLSQLERDYKMMAQTRIRAMAFEVGRKTREGSAGGPIFNNLLHGHKFWFNLQETQG